MSGLPTTQYAVQLVGPSQMELNKSKPVPQPGPFQLLAKIECVGLCFSDLKLLKQFHDHPRKSEVVGGLSPEILAEIPSYVPGNKATVPGHEVTCRIVAVGEKVSHHTLGERVMVQADFRDLPTAGSNGAFGYNFEGALQEYVLLDERVVIEKSGQRLLISAPEDLSASAVALVEPWACVEASYVNPERQTLKAGGKALVVSDGPASDIKAMHLPLSKEGGPASVVAIRADKAAAQVNESFDDIIYFGVDKHTIETLNDKLASRGLMNIVLGGKRIGQEVSVGVGRVHYGLTRWIGTAGTSAADSYKNIPATGELRPHDKVQIIGAAGPMGQMHVIRTVCSGVDNLELVATDMDDARLESLRKKAAAPAKANGVALHLVNTQKTVLAQKFSYIALMAPLGPLVAAAIRDSLPGCLINIFAGIPAPIRQDLDLDTYIANRCYMFGTSGSVIGDMKIVLEKVASRQLDTNRSVDAICGMAGAIDGIAAVENRTLAGKILVYPMLHEVGLIPLAQLQQHYPMVAAKLEDGNWTQAAEEELLRTAGTK